jgi:hypothetical protein
LVAEARLIQNSTPLQHISKLFMEISKHLRDKPPMEAESSVKTLQGRRIFPVRDKEDERTFNYLSSGESSQSWFIANYNHLRDSFHGIVPLLAFNIQEVKKMEHLIQALGLEARKLSCAVKSQAEQDGHASFHEGYSSFLRSKARFIKQLVPLSRFRLSLGNK